MKKGITDIVQRLSGWGDVPDYEILEVSDNGDNISLVVKKECCCCGCCEGAEDEQSERS